MRFTYGGALLVDEGALLANTPYLIADEEAFLADTPCLHVVNEVALLFSYLISSKAALIGG